MCKQMYTYNIYQYIHIYLPRLVICNRVYMYVYTDVYIFIPEDDVVIAHINTIQIESQSRVFLGRVSHNDSVEQCDAILRGDYRCALNAAICVSCARIDNFRGSKFISGGYHLRIEVEKHDRDRLVDNLARRFYRVFGAVGICNADGVDVSGGE